MPPPLLFFRLLFVGVSRERSVFGVATGGRATLRPDTLRWSPATSIMTSLWCLSCPGFTLSVLLDDGDDSASWKEPTCNKDLLLDYPEE
jgi:hypothetical protein